MNVEGKKLELIEWILKLKDASTLHEILKVKKNHSHHPKKQRQFGGGKHIFTYIADDFDQPLDDFQPYMK